MTEIVRSPSIGSIRPDFDRVGDRMRQIVDRPIQNLDFLGSTLRNANMLREQYGATRSLVRAVTSSGIDVVQVCEEQGHRLEASIPLAGDLSGFNFNYYGRNESGRIPSAQTLEEETALIGKLLKKDPKPPSQIIEQARRQGFELERLQGSLTPGDYDRIIEMYRSSFTTYPFDIQTMIKQMVEDPTYQVYVARSVAGDDRQLYAVCVTEQVDLKLGDRKFVIREMGDSAKMPSVNGLNAPLKLMLVAEALKDGVDLVFCETRAALGAVNAVNQSIGMQYAGFLPHHTLIGGPSDIKETGSSGEESKFGNMNVWALNRSEIERIGSEAQQAIQK